MHQHRSLETTRGDYLSTRRLSNRIISVAPFLIRARKEQTLSSSSQSESSFGPKSAFFVVETEKWQMEFLSTVNVLYIASNFTNSHKSFLPDLDVLWPIEAATLLLSVIHHSFPLSLLDKHEDSEWALLLRSGLVVELLRFSGCLSLRERLRQQNWELNRPVRHVFSSHENVVSFLLFRLGSVPIS